jgi:hypothetical protein
MLRRKSAAPAPAPKPESPRETEIDVDGLPKFDDELSPREAMARLTSAIEKKIDASFALRRQTSK